MTENEAKAIDDCLKELRGHRGEYLKRSTPWRIINRAVHLIEELKAYRAIGTIEDFKALKEKNEPKKMSIGNDNGKSRKCCGNCRCFVLPTSNYCSKCGQKLDWQ